MVKAAEEIREKLKDDGYDVSLINARFVKPIDEEMIEEAAGEHHLIVTLEENVRCGGFGEAVLSYANQKKFHARILNIHLPDAYIEHGSVRILKNSLGFDSDSLYHRSEEALHEGEA